MEIKRFLCSRFRVMCLWNASVNSSTMASKINSYSMVLFCFPLVGMQSHFKLGGKPFKIFLSNFEYQFPDCPTSAHRIHV